MEKRQEEMQERNELLRRIKDPEVRRQRLMYIRKYLHMGREEFDRRLLLCHDRTYKIEHGIRPCTPQILALAEVLMRRYQLSTARLRGRIAKRQRTKEPPIVTPEILSNVTLKQKVIADYIRLGMQPAGLAKKYALRPSVVDYFLSTLQND